jgi:hypothetical protein
MDSKLELAAVVVRAVGYDYEPGTNQFVTWVNRCEVDSTEIFGFRSTHPLRKSMGNPISPTLRQCMRRWS